MNEKNAVQCGDERSVWAVTHTGPGQYRAALVDLGGPFRIIYDTDEWDTAPGDSASIPAKWISPDGRTLHLVFSGEDSFSVREFSLAE